MKTVEASATIGTIPVMVRHDAKQAFRNGIVEQQYRCRGGAHFTTSHLDEEIHELPARDLIEAQP